MKAYKTKRDCMIDIYEIFGNKGTFIYNPIWITKYYFPNMNDGFYISSTIGGKCKIYDEANKKMVEI